MPDAVFYDWVIANAALKLAAHNTRSGVYVHLNEQLRKKAFKAKLSLEQKNSKSASFAGLIWKIETDFGVDDVNASSNECCTEPATEFESMLPLSSLEIQENPKSLETITALSNEKKSLSVIPLRRKCSDLTALFNDDPKHADHTRSSSTSESSLISHPSSTKKLYISANC